MLVLGIDTATQTASIALVRDDAVIAAAEVMSRTHGDVLLPAIDALVRGAGLGPRDLDAIAIGAGPGSFTGLRIGMATAKGIAFAADRPLWIVSSLAALAWGGATAGGLLVPVLDARRAEVYAGFYRAGERGVIEVATERVLPPAELAAAIATHRDGGPVAVFGDALQILGELGDGVAVRADLPRTPSGAAVAQLGAWGDRVDALDRGAPAYIRPAEAEIMYPDGVPGALRKR
jgi:tRNA threonylcarbamoyladenosine biosynthesis protein TsaB